MSLPLEIVDKMHPCDACDYWGNYPLRWCEFCLWFNDEFKEDSSSKKWFYIVKDADILKQDITVIFISSMKLLPALNVLIIYKGKLRNDSMSNL